MVTGVLRSNTGSRGRILLDRKLVSPQIRRPLLSLTTLLEGGKRACVFSEDSAVLLDEVNVEKFFQTLKGKGKVVLEAVRRNNQYEVPETTEEVVRAKREREKEKSQKSSLSALFDRDLVGKNISVSEIVMASSDVKQSKVEVLHDTWGHPTSKTLFRDFQLGKPPDRLEFCRCCAPSKLRETPFPKMSLRKVTKVAPVSYTHLTLPTTSRV